MFDAAHATDRIRAGTEEGSPACDRIMRAVDQATARLLGNDLDRQPEQFPEGWLKQALEHEETSLREVVDRFRRGLRHGLSQQ